MGKEEPLLSIVIPVYKVEPYIEKCLESIYSQIDSLPVEVVIVNDGTPDNSMKIVQRFVNKQTLIINQENQGLSVARNNGIAASHGKYVWCVDSDDWIASDKIKDVCDWIKMYSKCEVLVIGIKAFDEDGHTIPSFHPRQPVSDVTIKSGAKWILTPNFERGPMQIFIISRDFILRKQLYYIPGLLHEDMDYAPRMLIDAENVAYIPEDVYCYLIRSNGSITSTVNPKRFSDLFSILSSHESLTASLAKNSDQYKAMCASQWMLLRSLISYLKIQRYEGPDLFKKKNAKLVRKIALRSLGCKMKFTYKIKFFLTYLYPKIYKFIRW